MFIGKAQNINLNHILSLENSSFQTKISNSRSHQWVTFKLENIYPFAFGWKDVMLEKITGLCFQSLPLPSQQTPNVCASKFRLETLW